MKSNRRRPERILEVMERSDDPSVSELTQIMDVMRMHETCCTPEQLAQLEARREEVGSDEIGAIEREWAELSAQMKAHRDAGTDPSDPEVRALAERWGDLTERTIAGFTGGDPAPGPATPRTAALPPDDDPEDGQACD